MLFRLALLLTIVPIVELSLMLEVHRAVAEAWGTGAGLIATLGSILLTGVVGAALARRQGLATIRALREAMARGASPADPLVDGAMILVGAMLLLAPGFLTDLVGFSLLIPPTRRLYRRAFLRWLARKVELGEAVLLARGFRPGSTGPFDPGSGPVIDVTPPGDAMGRDDRPPSGR